VAGQPEPAWAQRALEARLRGRAAARRRALAARAAARRRRAARELDLEVAEAEAAGRVRTSKSCVVC
jgi:hypothetical protein